MRTTSAASRSTTWTKQASAWVVATTSSATRRSTTREVVLLGAEIDDLAQQGGPGSVVGDGAAGGARVARVGRVGRPAHRKIPLSQGEGHRLGAVGHLELAEDRADVSLDGLLAEHEAGGDGAIGVAVHHQLQHLAFPLAEAEVGSRPELTTVETGG